MEKSLFAELAHRALALCLLWRFKIIVKTSRKFFFLSFFLFLKACFS